MPVSDLPLCPSCHAPVSARATNCVLCDAPLVPLNISTGANDALVSYVTDETVLLRPELRPVLTELNKALAPSIRVTRLLGEGGMGLVFMGRDATLKRDVAIKVLSPALSDDSVARTRFRREAEASAAVSHPNIVSVFQVGELSLNRIPFFVMQYVEGPTLGDAKGRTLPEPRVRRLMTEIAAALAAAHRRKLVHRDVKPGNIVLDGETGRALVLDFGIAAALSSRRRSRGLRLTTEGMYLGTPTYMSPEQASGDDVTPKSDVYSLGILVYEMLAGKPPFEGNALQVMASQVKDRPPDLRELRPDLSTEVLTLVQRCLEKDPARRPTAQEIVNHLSTEAKHAIQWPPPGLARFRSAGARLIRTAAGMTVMLMVFVLALAVQPRDTVPGAVTIPVSEHLLATWSFVLASSVALMLWFAVQATMRADVASRLARAAHASGYPWAVLARVAADGFVDTSDLMNGMGVFAFAAPDERRHFIRLRRRFVTCLVAAFLLLVMTSALWLADWLGLGPAATPLSVTPIEAFGILAPSAMALVGAALCLVPELRWRRREHVELRRRISGEVNRDLVHDWLTSAGVAPVERRRGRAQALAGVPLAVVVIGIALAAVVVMSVVAETTTRYAFARSRGTHWSSEALLFADPANAQEGLRIMDDRTVAPDARLRLLKAVFLGQCLNTREMLFGVSGSRLALYDSASSRLADISRGADEAARWREYTVEWSASPALAADGDGETPTHSTTARVLAHVPFSSAVMRMVLCSSAS